MIALDTNVLLRHILQDDPPQSHKSTELIDQHERILITDIVLIETIWTISGKKYQAKRSDIIKLVNDLLSEPKISFENPQVVWAALCEYSKNRPIKNKTGEKLKLPDFTDAMIIAKVKQIAKQWGENLDAVYSFDNGALRIAGTQEP